MTGDRAKVRFEHTDLRCVSDAPYAAGEGACATYRHREPGMGVAIPWRTKTNSQSLLTSL